MSAAFEFQHRIEFSPENSAAILRASPAAPGVFALRGAAANAEPYLTRAADLRRRMRRLLAPPEEVDEQGRPLLSKRLNLREKVAWIEYTRTGSEFESALTLYCATRSAFGHEQARKRLRLYPPYFLRVTMGAPHPRVYATNRLSRRTLGEFFGPFPSRAAADRYCDAVLDFFKLRRCHEDLHPFPEHPGCVYGEMNKCLEPCKGAAFEGGPKNPSACTPAEYAAEAERVFAFFATRGESILAEIAKQRDTASEAMNFEQAATLHAQWEKVRAASLLADELVRPIRNLRALVIQESAPREALDTPSDLSSQPESAHFADAAERPAAPQPTRPAPLDEAALFLLDHGRLTGPERLSTLGVRAVREQTAVGSSLFAQPLMLAAIPLDEPSRPATVISTEAPSAPCLASETWVPAGTAATLPPEDRARAALDALTTHAQTAGEPDIAERCDYLSLFRRWYYRPEKQRQGEIFLPNADASWPIRRILNGSARVVLGPPAPMPPVDREAAKELKTKIIHAGREGVEREVPVLPKRSRSRKAVTPEDLHD